MKSQAKFNIDSRKDGFIRFIWYVTIAVLILFSIALLILFTQEEMVSKRARDFLAKKTSQRAKERKPDLALELINLLTAGNNSKTQTSSRFENDASNSLIDRFSTIKDKVKSEVKEFTDSEIGSNLLSEVNKHRDQVADFMDNHIDQLINKLVALYQAKTADTEICQKLPQLVSETFKLDKSENGISIQISSSISQNINNDSRPLQIWQKHIRKDYNGVNTKLIAELRLFSFINFGVFALLFILIYFLHDKAAYFILPATLLLLSTVISLAIYIFVQDWFNTIMYGNYWGMTYLAWISGVFLLFIDVIFFKAFFTIIILEIIVEILSIFAQILSAIFGAIG